MPPSINIIVSNRVQAYNEGIIFIIEHNSISSIGSNDLNSLIPRSAFKCRIKKKKKNREEGLHFNGLSTLEELR